MKKITITAILAFIFAMATVSCEDDYDTRIPTFDGVTLTPDRCIPSTQITLSLNVKDKGENAYIYDTKITVVNDANPRNEKTFRPPRECLHLTTQHSSSKHPTHQEHIP